jgi:hypothetical membrane protein
MVSRNGKIAGTLLVVGGIQFVIALVIAEALYPGYSIADNYISDLGVWGNASALVFNASIIFLGITSLIASFFIKRYFQLRKGFYIYAIAGLGSLGAGVFSENTFIFNGLPVFHAIFALLAFLLGAVAGLFTYHIIKSPLRYISLILGVTSLVALAVFLSTQNSGALGIGVGALERLVAYPTSLGVIAFGGYLIGDDKAV